MERVLEINDLVIHYITREGVVEAVNGISLHLDKGETLGLVGETGAGKTTTALGIMRLIPNPPGKILGGEILFNGEDLTKKSETQMRDIRGGQISMIFQDPMTALNPVLRIGEQIEEVVKQHNSSLSKKEITQKAAEMLEMVDIPRERAIDYPHQFSGGMKQRVVIAIALACSPSLLLADEPTTALDVTIQAQVLDMMKKLKDELQTSMVLITHDLGVVAEVCDRVAIMYAGEIVETGDLHAIYEDTRHPYTKGLFGSLPSLEVDTNRLSPIPGLMPDPTDLPKGCSFWPRCASATEKCKRVNPEHIEVSPGHLVKCHLFADHENVAEGV